MNVRSSDLFSQAQSYSGFQPILYLGMCIWTARILWAGKMWGRKRGDYAYPYGIAIAFEMCILSSISIAFLCRTNAHILHLSSSARFYNSGFLDLLKTFSSS